MSKGSKLQGVNAVEAVWQISIMSLYAPLCSSVGLLQSQPLPTPHAPAASCMARHVTGVSKLNAFPHFAHAQQFLAAQLEEMFVPERRAIPN